MPDNAGFAYAAYIATAIIYGAYALSLVLRSRRVRERLARKGAARQTDDR